MFRSQKVLSCPTLEEVFLDRITERYRGVGVSTEDYHVGEVALLFFQSVSVRAR